jgi:dolichyl-phosphate beta-glucosyltransferase
MPRPELSIVIPAFNEAEVIPTTLRELSEHLSASSESYEIIVASDGSTDATDELVQRIAASDPRIRLVRLPQNRGKGAALRAGIAATEGTLVAFTDADMPYRLENLDAVVGRVRGGAAAIAVGARDLRESESDPSYPLVRKFAGRVLSILVMALLRIDVFDTQCGLKAFRGDVARRLFGESTIDRFGFDFEVIFLASREGLSIARVPVQLSHRHASRVRLVRDSLAMLRDLVAVRLKGRRRVR